MRKKTLLYIHGYAGQQYGRTYNRFNALLDKHKWNFESLDYNDKNGDEALKQLKEKIESEKIDMIIASSLGAYLALISTDDIKIPIIIINPCFKPGEILPLIEVPYDTIESWRKHELKLYANYCRDKKILPFFGNEDEVMGTKYKDEICKLYNTPAVMINSTHVISDEGVNTIARILNFM